MLSLVLKPPKKYLQIHLVDTILTSEFPLVKDAILDVSTCICICYLIGLYTWQRQVNCFSILQPLSVTNVSKSVSFKSIEDGFSSSLFCIKISQTKRLL